MRRRPGPVARGLLALLTASATVACAAGSSSPIPPAAVPPSVATCLPMSEPRTLADIDRIVNGFRAVDAFRGGDVGADVELRDGRHLFVFGDTLRAPEFGDSVIVRNSMLLFSTTCAAVVVPRHRGAIIPDRPDGVGYWPMSVVSLGADSTGERVAVFAQRVRGSERAGQFVTLGPAVALFDVDAGAAPALRSVTDLWPDLADRSRVTWGAAAWADGGWLYLYGTANPGRPLTFGWSLSVARLRPTDVTAPSRWSFWDGRRWQPDPADAAQLIPPVGGVSQTLSVFSRGGRWYAVSKRDGFLGTDLVVWDAPSPHGPFEANPPAALVPSDLGRGLYRYMPLAHPGVLPRAGHVIVSVSQNTADLAALLADPLLYRPRFLEIDLPD